jgi:hypothetical protein
MHAAEVADGEAFDLPRRSADPDDGILGVRFEGDAVVDEWVKHSSE